MPYEPSVLETHKIDDPLVEEFLGLFEDLQLELTRLAIYRVRAALSALMSDLLAARKVSGFDSHSAIFPCSHGYVCKQDITSLDINSWTRRHYYYHCLEAAAWLSLPTMERKEGVCLSYKRAMTVRALRRTVRHVSYLKHSKRAT